MADKNEKVLVGMSGGVDSSVAAYLLREAGYEVSGLFLRPGGRMADAFAGACRAADKLGVELISLDVEADFARIIDYFVDEYVRGRTPNPCIRCNALIKFAHLVAQADALGARYVATGHHARMVRGGTGFQPVPGTDYKSVPPSCAIHRAGEKDQSYALFEVPRENLGRILLPIGALAGKAEVRRIAGELGLAGAEEPDSQEICFVSGHYAELLRARRREALRPGDIVDSAGGVLGRHGGVANFTIGQRRGLGVAAGRPLYVTHIDAATATVTVGPKEQVMSRRLSAGGANWHIDPPAVGGEFDATVQIRYNHAGCAGRVRINAPGRFEVEFASPVAAVTAGQAAVIYDGEKLLGGGWIEKTGTRD